jgi:hypothetical protein
MFSKQHTYISFFETFLKLFVIVSTVHHVNYYFAKFKQTYECNLGTQMAENQTQTALKCMHGQCSGCQVIEPPDN